MAKYTIVVRATLQNEAGGDITWEDWSTTIETDSPNCPAHEQEKKT